MIRGTSKSWLRSWLGLSIAFHSIGLAEARSVKNSDDLVLCVCDEVGSISTEMRDALSRAEVRIIDHMWINECEPMMPKERVTADPIPEYEAPGQALHLKQCARPEQLEYG